MPASQRRTSARVDPIQAAVDAIPIEALECRRKRNHDWDGETVLDGMKRGEVEVTEKCQRGCGRRRVAWWNLDTGKQLTPWSPRYPDGYLIPGGLPDDARLGLQRNYLRRLRG